MKNKKLISEEIKRIHELMGVETLINEIFDDLKSSNLINEQILGLIPRLVKPGAKMSDAVEFARLIKDNTMVNASGQLIRAAQIPHATKLVQLGDGGNWEEFTTELIDLSKNPVGTPQRIVADEIIGGLVRKINDAHTELKNYESNLNQVKNDAITNGMSEAEATERMQRLIDQDFYSPTKQVEFAQTQVRDIYVNNLRKNLDLDTEWKLPLEDVVKQKTDVFTKLELSKKKAIEDRWDDLQKVMAALEKHSKLRGDNPPFKRPDWLSSKAKVEEFKTNVIDSIKNAVDARFKSLEVASEATLEKWLLELSKMDPAEQEAAILKVVNRVSKVQDSILKRFGVGAYKSTIGNIQGALVNVAEISKYLFKLDFKGLAQYFSNTFKTFAFKLLWITVIYTINEISEYFIRKYYDKDTLAPVVSIGLPPFGGTSSDWGSYLGKLFITGPILIWNAGAALTNGVYYGIHLQTEEGLTYEEELDNTVAVLKSEKILPTTKTRVLGDENTEQLLIKLFEYLSPNEEWKSDDFLSNVIKFGGTFIGDSSSLLDWDIVTGLPIEQFYVVGKDIYFVNKNGRFNVSYTVDSEGNISSPPTIRGKEGVYGDPDEETIINLKDLFAVKDGEPLNRYLRDLYPIDEQTPISEPLTAYPKVIYNPPGFVGESAIISENSVGLVNTETNIIMQGLATSGLDLDMSKFVSYEFYKPEEVEADPEKEGYFRTRPGTSPIPYLTITFGDKMLPQVVFYVDDKGTKVDGNYPVYRIAKVADNPADTSLTPGMWLIRKPKDGKNWQPLKDVATKLQFGSNTTQSTNENLSPKEQFEKDNPSTKLTLIASIGDLAVYRGSDNKRYKLLEGKIVDINFQK